MSEQVDWVEMTGRLRGFIDAHRILRGDDADHVDRILYTLTDELRKEIHGG